MSFPKVINYQMPEARALPQILHDPKVDHVLNVQAAGSRASGAVCLKCREEVELVFGLSELPFHYVSKKYFMVGDSLLPRT